MCVLLKNTTLPLFSSLFLAELPGTETQKRCQTEEDDGYQMESKETMTNFGLNLVEMQINYIQNAFLVFWGTVLIVPGQSASLY